MRKTFSLLSESSSSSGSGDFYGWITSFSAKPLSGELKFRCNYTGNIKKGDKVTLYSRHNKSQVYKGSVTEITQSSDRDKKAKNDDIHLTIKPDNFFKRLGIFNEVALISNKNNIEYLSNFKCKFSSPTGFIENIKAHSNRFVYLIPLTENIGSNHYEFNAFHGKISEPHYTTDDNYIANGTIHIKTAGFCPIAKGMKFILTNHDGNEVAWHMILPGLTALIKSIGSLFGAKLPASMLICEVI